MSLGTDRAKIATEENGERKFLKNIATEPVSYELTTEADAEYLTVDELIVDIKHLQQNEPERKFFVVS